VRRHEILGMVWHSNGSFWIHNSSRHKLLQSNMAGMSNWMLINNTCNQWDSNAQRKEGEIA